MKGYHRWHRDPIRRGHAARQRKLEQDPPALVTCATCDLTVLATRNGFFDVVSALNGYDAILVPHAHQPGMAVPPEPPHYLDAERQAAARAEERENERAGRAG